jgi:carbonic anhydrase/acetyltransferase-like protein (isoleucine patch superfamily)
VAHFIPFEGKEPSVAPDAFIAPTAVLIGDVVVEQGASIWFGAVLRGDFDRIVVGAGSSVQDNCVVHTNEDLPTIIGQNVTVGHLSLLEGCVIEEGAIVGMGSIVLNRACVGQRTMLAAGSVVTEDSDIPAEVLAAGAPAEAKKELDGSSSKWIEGAACEYQALRLRYTGGARAAVAGISGQQDARSNE